MIDVSKFLSPKLVDANFQAKDKKDAIVRLVDVLLKEKAEHKRIDPQGLLYEVLKREDMQTTGLGKGLAFPHARIEGWGDFSIAIAIARQGVDFKSVDGISVKFIFLMISSPDEPYIILQTMAAIIRFLNEEVQNDLLSLSDASSEKVIERFSQSNVSATDQILACDVARVVRSSVDLEATVEEVARTMHLKRLDVLPVVDANNKFCGEISCLEIFEYGMPNFFKQLHTVSFIRHIDPFEKYFRIKRNLKVKDIFIKNTQPIKKDRTLLEIIFEMTVKKKDKLFVVNDDGVLAGVIDRFCIIDKILFF